MQCAYFNSLWRDLPVMWNFSGKILFTKNSYALQRTMAIVCSCQPRFLVLLLFFFFSPLRIVYPLIVMGTMCLQLVISVGREMVICPAAWPFTSLLAPSLRLLSLQQWCPKQHQPWCVGCLLRIASGIWSKQRDRRRSCFPSCITKGWSEPCTASVLTSANWGLCLSPPCRWPLKGGICAAALDHGQVSECVSWACAACWPQDTLNFLNEGKILFWLIKGLKRGEDGHFCTTDASLKAYIWILLFMHLGKNRNEFFPNCAEKP